MSREHFVSRGVLEAQTRDGVIFVRNFLWQKEPVWGATPESLASKVLCKRHNEALSPLDAVASKLFDRLCALPELDRASGIISAESVWRPENLIWTYGPAQKLLHLVWSRGSGAAITYYWAPP